MEIVLPFKRKKLNKHWNCTFWLFTDKGFPLGAVRVVPSLKRIQSFARHDLNTAAVL